MRRSPPKYAPMTQEQPKKPGKFNSVKRAAVNLSDDVALLLMRTFKKGAHPTMTKFLDFKPEPTIPVDVKAKFVEAIRNLQASAKTILNVFQGKEKYDPGMYINLLQELRNARSILQQYGTAMADTPEYHKLDVDIAATQLALKRLRIVLRDQGMEKFMRRDDLPGDKQIDEDIKDTILEIRQAIDVIRDLYDKPDADPKTRIKLVTKIIDDIDVLGDKIYTMLLLFIKPPNKPATEEGKNLVVKFNFWQQQYMTWVKKFTDDYDRGKFTKIAKNFIGRFAFKPGVKLAARVARRGATRGIKPTLSRVGGAVKAGLKGNWGRAAKQLDVAGGQVLRSPAIRKPIQGAMVAAKKKLGHRGRKMISRWGPMAATVGGVVGFGAAQNKAQRAIGMGGDYEGAKKSITFGDIYKGLTNIEANVRKIYGGKARSKGVTEEQVDPEQLKMGIEVELEHTDNRHKAKQIALDHLAEIKDYYTRLKRLEEDAPKSVKKAAYAKIIRGVARGMRRTVRHPMSLEAVTHGTGAFMDRDKKKK